MRIQWLKSKIEENCGKQGSADSKNYLFAFISLLIALVLIYGNSFNCSWHFDDFGNIVNNTNVHLTKLSFSKISQVFYGKNTSAHPGARPLAFLSFALNYWGWKLSLPSYHAINLILHYITAVFLFLFVFKTLSITRLKDDYGEHASAIAILTAFLWAVHPIQVTAVTYIVQRMAVMAAMFFIISMFCFLMARTSESKLKMWCWFLLCAVCYVFSLLSKENGALLPLILVLYDILILKDKPDQHPIKNYGLILAVILVCVTAGLIYAGGPSSIINGYGRRPFTMGQRLLTEPRVILYYISLLLYPVSSRFTLIHNIDWSRGLLAPWTTLPSIVILVSMIFLLIYYSRKKPLIAFAGLFFFLNHGIEGSFLPLELIYEHRNYLPSMMFFVIISILIIKSLNYFHYSRPFQAMIGLAAAIVIACIGHTAHFRNEVFHSELSLWMDNVQKAPELSIVHNNLGKCYWNMGLPEKAMGEYRKALQVNKFYSKHQTGALDFNIGIYDAYEKKDLKSALNHFKKAFKSSNGSPGLWYEMTRIYIILNKIEKADDLVSQGLRVWKTDLGLLDCKSVILFKKGELWQGLNLARKNYFLHPKNALTCLRLGEIFMKEGKISKAVHFWEKTLILAPSNMRALLALMELYEESGEKVKLAVITGRFIALKNSKSLEEIIRMVRETPELRLYTPDALEIRPIFQNVLRRVLGY